MTSCLHKSESEQMLCEAQTLGNYTYIYILYIYVGIWGKKNPKPHRLKKLPQPLQTIQSMSNWAFHNGRTLLSHSMPHEGQTTWLKSPRV